MPTFTTGTPSGGGSQEAQQIAGGVKVIVDVIGSALGLETATEFQSRQGATGVLQQLTFNTPSPANPQTARPQLPDAVQQNMATTDP